MTLEEVARRARVSTATVSRVLNNGASVKSSTRARVLKVMQELKYSPNLHAQSLAGGRSRTIGVIVSNIENPFFLDVYKTVEAGAHAAGYELVMANTDYSPERLVASIRLMLGRRPAGLAAIVSEMDATLIQELSGHPIPVVFYDVGTPRRNITNIRVDYRSGMAKLSSYLYSLGPSARRLRRPPRHPRARSTSGCRRCATPPASIPGWRSRSRPATDSLEGGRQAARVLLARSPRPTALVCVNDVMAVGALREVRDARPARARGRLGDRVRQRHAGAVLRADADDRAHPARPDRPRDLRLPDAERRRRASRSSWSSPSSSSAIRPAPPPADGAPPRSRSGRAL